MAIVKEKAQEKTQEVDRVELAEAMAKASKFFQKYEDKLGWLNDLVKEVHSLRSSLVTLINAETVLDARNKKAIIECAAKEKQATERLQTVEMGHRALIDRLSKKELELNAKLSEIEKRELATMNARHELEVMKGEYAKKLDSLTK